jgi:hypothetical protein
MNKVTLLEKRLKEIKETFEAMKKNGISEEIMIPYCLGLARQKARNR